MSSKEVILNYFIIDKFNKLLIAISRNRRPQTLQACLSVAADLQMFWILSIPYNLTDTCKLATLAQNRRTPVQHGKTSAPPHMHPSQGHALKPTTLTTSIIEGIAQDGHTCTGILHLNE